MECFGTHLNWFNCTNKLFHTAAEWTIKWPQFQKFLSSSNFQNIVSIAADCTIKRPRLNKFISSSNFRKHRISDVIRQHLASLILTIFSAVPPPKTSFHIPLECIRMYRSASLISKCSHEFHLFLKKKFQGATPLVTDFARMHPRQLKLPICLTATTKVYSMSLYD